MRISRARFVIFFLVSAFAFQFISNSVLGPEVRLFPLHGEPFPGAGSSIGWKSNLAAILYPVKVVLTGPLAFLYELPDPPPPLLVLAFVIYWTAIALLLYYLLTKINRFKKSELQRH